MTNGGIVLLPDQLERDLDRARAYWDGLKRGANDIPFWDDVRFSMQARLAHDVVLMEVFEDLPRFRFLPPSKVYQLLEPGPVVPLVVWGDGYCHAGAAVRRSDCRPQCRSADLFKINDSGASAL